MFREGTPHGLLETVIKGSFDCVAVRFAHGCSAQDDKGKFGELLY